VGKHLPHENHVLAEITAFTMRDELAVPARFQAADGRAEPYLGTLAVYHEPKCDARMHRITARLRPRSVPRQWIGEEPLERGARFPDQSDASMGAVVAHERRIETCLAHSGHSGVAEDAHSDTVGFREPLEE